MSFSPLSIRTSPRESLTLSRRDLFDARFQLISMDTDGAAPDRTSQPAEDTLGFLDAPSDLVPGVYEGGLKTWECSIDLAECLHKTLDNDTGRRLKGKSILEVRHCGKSRLVVEVVSYSRSSTVQFAYDPSECTHSCC